MTAAAFNRAKLFEELNRPLPLTHGMASGSGAKVFMMTPAEQKAAALGNLMAGFDTDNRLTPGTGLTLRELRFNGLDYESVFDAEDFSLGNGGSNASLGIGAAAFVVSAGDPITVLGAALNGAFSSTAAYTDTPDTGFGTVVASGAVSVLGGTATFESIMGGVASAAINAGGAIKNISGLGPGTALPVSLLAAASIYFNAAAAWDNVTAAPILFNGVIAVRWRPLVA